MGLILGEWEQVVLFIRIVPNVPVSVHAHASARQGDLRKRHAPITNEEDNVIVCPEPYQQARDFSGRLLSS